MKTYPFLNEAPRREDVLGSEGIAACGGEGPASLSGRCTPGEKARVPIR